MASGTTRDASDAGSGRSMLCYAMSSRAQLDHGYPPENNTDPNNVHEAPPNELATGVQSAGSPTG